MEIPDKIYLQVDEEGQRPETSCDGVTWCEDRINKSDIEYVRAEQRSEAGQVDTVVKCEHKGKKWVAEIAETYCPMCREIL